MAGITEWIAKVNGAVNGVVWGPAVLLLLAGTGVYLTVRTGWVQAVRFGYILRKTLGSLFRVRGKRAGDAKKPHRLPGGEHSPGLHRGYWEHRRRHRRHICRRARRGVLDVGSGLLRHDHQVYRDRPGGAVPPGGPGGPLPRRPYVLHGKGAGNEVAGSTVCRHCGPCQFRHREHRPGGGSGRLPEEPLWVERTHFRPGIGRGGGGGDPGGRQAHRPDRRLHGAVHGGVLCGGGALPSSRSGSPMCPRPSSPSSGAHSNWTLWAAGCLAAV